MEYIIHIFIMTCMNIMLAQSLCITSGYCGRMSVAHASFWGLGAYSATLFSMGVCSDIFVNMLLSVLVTGVFSFIVAVVINKIPNELSFIVTIGIQEIIYSFFNNLDSITNGPLGINNIPSFFLFGIPLLSKLSILIFIVGISTICCIIIYNITHSGFGRLLICISEDELLASSFGKNTSMPKKLSFVVSSCFASVVGVLFSLYMGYIDPSSFSVESSILFLCILIVGGEKSFKGIFLSALFFSIFPELLRFIGIPPSVCANINKIVFGVMTIVIIWGMQTDSKHCRNH